MDTVASKADARTERWNVGARLAHHASLATLAESLESSASGLTWSEARRRHSLIGPNALPGAPARSILLRFADQFRSLLIYVLLAAAAVTAVLGHYTDTVVIVAVVLANAVFGVVQEGRALRALDAIGALLSEKASVLRDGRRVTIPARDLVPGDVVLLEAGDRVPADLRLLVAHNLQIQEAMLTGESVPVEKSAEPVAEAAVVGDRTCMAFSGTMVTSGTGTGMVAAIGQATQIGQIREMVGRVRTLETPLLRQMNAFARRLTVVILAIGAFMFGFGWLVQGAEAKGLFIAVVATVVAAVPEGLPAVLTITLAIGVRRMARERALVRQLPAVETMGSVSVICTDKTGTLTRNEMTVDTALTGDGRYRISGTGYAPEGEVRRDDAPAGATGSGDLAALAAAALLCNDARLSQTAGGWSIEGDPMEGALVALAGKCLSGDAVRAAWPRIDAVPFDAQTRYMATLHAGPDGSRLLAVKGAPEAVLPLCAVVATRSGSQTIDLRRWQEMAADLAAQGRRVLAIAEKRLDPHTQRIGSAELAGGLTLLGIVGLIDPPRPEARDAIAECRRAGIAVKMITGDHAGTAMAVARALGLERWDRPATGAEIDAIDDAELARAIARTDVFARTSPAHKLRIVRLLQSSGAIAAMTGDGVNDAPALRQADIGVAMGLRGSEAAREASKLVLTDDNFATIVAAVREGRIVYDNIRKVVQWTLPTNGGEALCIVSAILLGLTLPMTALQILWINLVTAVALGMVLAFEPGEADIMRRPPRARHESLLSRALAWRIVFVSGLFVGAAYSIFEWMLSRGESLEAARTATVNAIVALEIAYLFAVRYARGPSITTTGVRGTRPVILGVGAVCVGQALFTYLPWLQRVFATEGLDPTAWLAIAGLGAALLVILEIEKFVTRRAAAGTSPGTA